MKNIGVLPANFITINAGEIGSSLEVLFLAFALSDRYNIYRKEKDLAQDQIIKMEKSAKEVLEKSVKRRTKQLQKANDELATLNEEILQQAEEINAQKDNLSIAMQELHKQKESIVSSINYAKTIQAAILPFREKMDASLNQFFIFYQPRDIVSGDFYFFQDKETHLILAAIDCTGHGVPGAFMSMIGHEILTEIVNVRNIYSPEQILEELHKGIHSSLQQSKTENRDGMDVALVTIKRGEDSKFDYLEYAGAMNPFYFVQKPLKQRETQEVTQQVIKATKSSLGGKKKQSEIGEFEKHRVELKGFKTKFWLSTDGFQDQFGGEENKKFMVKRFRELLFSMHDKSMEEQENIIQNTFEDWKGESRQIDDVLLIGVEI